MTNYNKHPEDLLKKVTSYTLVDLQHQSIKLMNEFGDVFVPPKEGLYLEGFVDPILKGNKLYYARKDFQKRKAIKSLDHVIDLDDDIYDDQKNIVMSRRFINNKKKHLTTRPKISISAIFAIRACILNYLYGVCRYARVGLRLSPESFIIDDFIDKLNEKSMESFFSEILEEIHDFIGEDTWHIYFCRTKNTVLVIEKSIDYRIFDWYRLKEQERFDLDSTYFDDFEKANEISLRQISNT